MHSITCQYYQLKWFFYFMLYFGDASIASFISMTPDAKATTIHDSIPKSQIQHDIIIAPSFLSIAKFQRSNNGSAVEANVLGQSALSPQSKHMGGIETDAHQTKEVETENSFNSDQKRLSPDVKEDESVSKVNGNNFTSAYQSSLLQVSQRQIERHLALRNGKLTPELMTDPVNREMMEQIQREELELSQKESKDESTAIDTMMKRDEDAVQISDYSDTIRQGSIDSSIGDIKYDKPSKLQTKITELMQQIHQAIDHYSPDQSFSILLRNVAPDYPSKSKLFRWKTECPWISLISQGLARACPNSDIDMSGDPDDPDAFPNCFINYLLALPEDSKLDMGQRLRGVLQNKDQIEDILNTRDGLCVPVAKMLNLRRDYCLDILQLFQSVVEFIRISTTVQEYEKNYYGDEAAMIFLKGVLREQHNIPIDSKKQHFAEDGFKSHQTKSLKSSFMQITSNEHRLSRLNSLKARYVFRRMDVLALQIFKSEALNLRKVWYNDPIHKWRYSLGLFQYITILGTWISEQISTLIEQ